MTTDVDREPELDLEPEPEPADDALEIEPDADDVEADPETELEPEPELEPAAAAEPSQALTAPALMQVLPADFPLPTLIRFVPDVRLRAAVDDATRYALSIEVKGAEQVSRADVALGVLRTSLKAVEEHFDEPTSIANKLHKSLTGTLSEWQKAGKDAVTLVGQRVRTEQAALKAQEDEETRKKQEEANRQERENRRLEAEAAERQKAPPAVVEELRKQATTAVAPPVARQASAPVLQNNIVTEAWTSTIAGTPRDAAEQHPDMADLSNPQRAAVLTLLRAVLDGKAPIVCFEINWSYLNKRAKADKSTFTIPGLEAYDAGGVRAKSTRGR